MPTRVLLSRDCYAAAGERARCLLLAAAYGVLLGACSPTVQTSNELAPSPAVVPAMSAVPPEILSVALDDAARRTGMAREALTVLVAESVVWSDGSIGCPVPGMSYTQALVPGFRIVVRAGADQLEYHAGARGQPVFCPPGRSTPPVSSEPAD